MALNDALIRSAKPGQRAYKHYDNDGLFLLVTTSGGRLWRFKYRYGHKEKVLALGRYPKVGLLDARKKAQRSARGAR